MLEVDFLTIFFFFFFSFAIFLDHVDVGDDFTCYQKSFLNLHIFAISCLN